MMHLEMMMVMIELMIAMMRMMLLTTDIIHRATDGLSLLVTNQAFDFPHCSRLKIDNIT